MIPLPARVIVRFRQFVLAFWVVVAALALPHAMSVDDVATVEGVASSPTQRRSARLA